MAKIKSITNCNSAEEVVDVLKTRFEKVSETSRLNILESIRVTNKKDCFLGRGIFVHYKQLYPETFGISYIKIGKTTVYTKNERGLLTPGTQMNLNLT